MKQKFFCTLFLIFLFHIVNAQLADSLSKKVDAIFDTYNKANSPGCALAILKDGKILYKKGYGISNLEYNIAINSSSVFHVASLSKQFTAAAIIRLSLEGKLNLNDDIRKYIPEVPDFGHTITLNHLLHHTSGLRDQWELQSFAGWRNDDLITEKDILEMLAREKSLNFLPGDEENYCNTGYTLLGVAVKRISGVSLREYADSVFFKPLGMTNTHFHSDHSEITPNRTSAYKKDENGKWKISIPVFDTYGATSLFTTVEDLAKWDGNFYTKKVGGNQFINAILTTGVLNNKTPQAYASGLYTDTYKGYKTVLHSGADAGYRSIFIRFPDEHFSVILLANLANIRVKALSFKVADVFLIDKSLKDSAIAFKTDSTIVKKWAGEYIDMTTKSTMELNYQNGNLQIDNTVLKPYSNFIFSDFNSKISCTFSGNSKNEKCLLSAESDINRTFEKIHRIKLTPAQLQEYKGEFYSPELDTKYKITTNESVLLVKIPRNEDMEFSPFIKDMFYGDFNISFTRDKRNKITGFFLTTGSVRNLYFKKLTTNF
ncbi:MAG TPA: serine hydrolase domain-containing protein [Segetibacter sp.]|nr:serine hydrolase domain-containing protein [Segetibacter sp.]